MSCVFHSHVASLSFHLLFCLSICFQFMSWLVFSFKPYFLCVCLCEVLSSPMFEPSFLISCQFHVSFGSSLDFFPLIYDYAFFLYISACTCDGRCQILWNQVPVCGGKHSQTSSGSRCLANFLLISKAFIINVEEAGWSSMWKYSACTEYTERVWYFSRSEGIGEFWRYLLVMGEQHRLTEPCEFL